MGSYAQCWLGDFYVGSTKNDVDPGLIGLFRKSDKHAVYDRASEMPQQLRHWFEELEGGINEPVVYYAAPIAVIRDRLDLTGYTLTTSREAFQIAVKGEIKQTAIFSQKYRKEGIPDYFEQKNNILASLDPDSWLLALMEIRRNDLNKTNLNQHGEQYKDSLIEYMLCNDWYGFPGVDMNVALRLALEVCPDTQQLVYDVTDVVWAGYFSQSDDLIEYGLDFSVEEYRTKAKIILLTEGKSDSWILKESLQLLYPHLADYYSFMEFDVARAAGGAGNLATLVKAFVGAGIVNRIIALFDNDTGAAAASKSLERISLPSHIVVVKLPEYERLRSYPTYGPSGIVAMDVNGIAASIELYLGEDVLNDDNNGLLPVQWMGYDTGVRQYQGEVVSKERIHQRFRLKLEQAKLDQSPIGSEQWDGLKLVFSQIFSAFQPWANKQICNWAREYSGYSLSDGRDLDP